MFPVYDPHQPYTLMKSHDPTLQDGVTKTEFFITVFKMATVKYGGRLFKFYLVHFLVSSASAIGRILAFSFDVNC